MTPHRRSSDPEQKAAPWGMGKWRVTLNGYCESIHFNQLNCATGKGSEDGTGRLMSNSKNVSYEHVNILKRKKQNSDQQPGRI